MSDSVSVNFTFSGELANKGEINAYEAGRFYYGAVRLIYTVESFRHDAKILPRITKKNPKRYQNKGSAKWIVVARDNLLCGATNHSVRSPGAV